MTVYEAKEKEDFAKISEFIRSQSPDYKVANIWRKRWKDVPDFYKFQQESSDWHFFICEDETGKVIVVLAINLTECLPKGSKQPFNIWRFAISCMDEEDWKKNDGQYFMEMLVEVCRVGAEKYGVVQAHVCSWGQHTPYFETVFRDDMMVTAEKESEDTGTLLTVDVDIEKFVGKRK